METIILTFLALAGYVLHMALKYKGRSKSQRVWSFGYWIKDNFDHIIWSIVAFVVLVLVKDAAIQFLQIDISKVDMVMINRVYYFTAAYLNSSLLYNILGMLPDKLSISKKLF